MLNAYKKLIAPAGIPGDIHMNLDDLDRMGRSLVRKGIAAIVQLVYINGEFSTNGMLQVVNQIAATVQAIIETTKEHIFAFGGDKLTLSIDSESDIWYLHYTFYLEIEKA